MTSSVFSRARRLCNRVFNTLHFHEGRNLQAPEWIGIQNDQQGLRYREIRIQSEPDDYTVYCEGLNLGKEAKERASHGDALLVLVNEREEVVTFGWKTERRVFWISEIGFSVKNKGRAIFYDFYTPSQHQRRGYYERLLRLAFSKLRPNQPALVFALQTNVPPLRVYEKMGLRRKHIARMLVTGELSMKQPNLHVDAAKLAGTGEVASVGS